MTPSVEMPAGKRTWASHPFWSMLWALLSTLLLPGCGLPWDPDGTLESLRGGEPLRVGMIHAPPWVDAESEPPRGVEVGLVRQVAAELGTTAEFVQGPPYELLEAMKLGELDLVVGGWTQDALAHHHIAATRPYHVSKTVVATRLAAGPLESLAGTEVAYAEGRPWMAGLLRSRGAEPRATVRPLDRDMPAIVEEVELLAAEGWKPTPITLRERHYVWALPSGENGWLLWLERFLARHRAEMQELLIEETRHAASDRG